MNQKKAKHLRKWLRQMGWAWNEKKYAEIRTYDRTYSLTPLIVLPCPLPIRLDMRCGRAAYKSYKKAQNAG